MHNYDKLTGLIIEKYKTKRNFEKKMNLSEKSMYEKLQGKIQFKHNEMNKIIELLSIEPKDVYSYFFTKKVQKTEHKKGEINV